METKGFRIALDQVNSALQTARPVDPCTVVIIGATGDLAHRKLVPALYNLCLSRGLPDQFALLGFSRSIAPSVAFRSELRATTEQFSRTRPLDASTWDRFAARIETMAGSLEDEQAYPLLRARLDEIDQRHGTRSNRIFYFATPSRAFPRALPARVMPSAISSFMAQRKSS